MYETPDVGRFWLQCPLDWSRTLLRWGGFWAAVVLPVVHLPLLAVAGLTSESLPPLLALWTLNALALVAGRRHTPHGEPEPGRGDVA